ncbi:MAG: hypothetical protein ACFE0I_02540 [Elainellaceae cyanobacterium]
MNSQFLSSLPQAQKSSAIAAYLIDEQGNQYPFLYNPETQNYSRSANYIENPTALRSVQAKQYSHTSGRTLSLPNLLMESHSAQRSLRPLIDGLQSLLIANPSQGLYSPPVVYFLWGSERFGPAVLTSLNWEVTLILSGEPAEARVSLTLEEIPPDGSKTAQPNESTLNDVALTDRELEEASVLASDFLESNFRRLSGSIREGLRTQRYSINVAQDGQIGLLDTDGSSLGSIGIYDGFDFQGSLDDITA